MINDGKKQHNLAVKSLPALLKRIISKQNGDLYCLKCLHSYCTKDKLKKHKKICENHDYCYTEMFKENNKIIKYSRGEKSMKVPFVIYADLECLLGKIDTCHNNPKKSSIAKTTKHLASGYLLFTHCLIDATKNKLGYYRDKYKFL